MSENLDLARSIYADWERGDFSASDWAHSDIEYVVADGPSPGRWTGLSGMAEGWREFLSAWEGWRGVPEDYREVDEERVLVPMRPTGVGKTSGLDASRMGARGANLLEIDGGKVRRLVIYFDRDHALADLGLEE